MVDVNLIPSILPNIFIISNSLSPTQFASLVLPGLKPLFALKDPPQNMLTLLDNLPLLQEKADKGVFKEREVSYAVLWSIDIYNTFRCFAISV